MSKKIIKSTSVVGSMTLVSRISGLIRDIVLANLLGDKAVADVFLVAFRIPNFFRRLFGEGAFSAAFIPVFVDYRLQRSQSEQQQFLSLMLGRFSLLLAVISLLGILFAPVLVQILAPGFVDDTEKYEATINASRVTFPYLFFISLVAMSAAILNCCERFSAPAVTPVLLNLCLIMAALWLSQIIAPITLALAFGVLMAGVVQLTFQLPFLYHERYLVRPRLRVQDQKDPAKQGVWQVFRLMLPALFGVSVAQINVLINTVLASFMATGSIAWLYYSDRLMEFPVGVFGIALSTAVLPNLSAKHNRGSPKAFSNTLDWALRWVVMITLPATIGLIVLAFPMVATVFFHGDYTSHGVTMAANSLIAFALGLLPIIMVKILASGYHARKNTKTPVRIAVISIVVNIIISLALFIPLQHVGLALATSIAACCNASLLYIQLRRDGIYGPRPGWVGFLIQTLCAGLFMGALLWWLRDFVDNWLVVSIGQRILWLALCIVSGGIIYFTCLWLLGLRPTMMWLDKETEQA